MKPPTIRDVAALAQVSPTVVSYVINNGPRPVAPRTRQVVLRAIAELGYQPNQAAQALRTGRTQMIGMIGMIAPDLANPWYAELARAVQTAAADHDHTMVMLSHYGNLDVQHELITDLVRRGTDHLLLVAPAGRRGDVNLNATVPNQLTAATVVLDRPEALEGVTTICADLETGTADAVRHLVETHGHDHVAITLDEQDDLGSRHRERGWRRAHRETGRAAGVLARGPATREYGFHLGQRLLRSPNRPSAILAGTDLQAFGLIKAAWSLKLTIPDDVAIVAFDGTIGTEYCAPPLTVLRRPSDEMAELAVRTLLHPHELLTHHRFDMFLITRDSCGCGDPA